MNDLCQDLQAGLLVDYADGTSSPTQSVEIEAHLAQCPVCRQHLARLERSLEIAQDLFREAVETARAGDAPGARYARKRFSRVSTAALVLAATILLVLMPLIQRRRSAVPDPSSNLSDAPIVAASPQTGETTPEGVAGTESHAVDTAANELDTILAEIDRAERRARLMASWDLLSAEPGLESCAAEAREYISASFGDISDDGEAAENEAHESQQRRDL